MAGPGRCMWRGKADLGQFGKASATLSPASASVSTTPYAPLPVKSPILRFSISARDDGAVLLAAPNKSASALLLETRAARIRARCPCRSFPPSNGRLAVRHRPRDCLLLRARHLLSTIHSSSLSAISPCVLLDRALSDLSVFVALAGRLPLAIRALPLLKRYRASS